MAFHHHCAGYVETAEEIARFLDMTDPDLLGLVFDTGHYLYGTGSNDGRRVEDGLKRFGEPIWPVHFKDRQPPVAAKARPDGCASFTPTPPRLFPALPTAPVPSPPTPN